MVTVRINGEESLPSIDRIGTMGDLVEFVKANIDPDEIIVGLQLQGKDLSDADWRVPLSVQGDAVLDVTTGTRGEYLDDRLKSAPEILEAIVTQLAESREFFQNGNNERGNELFSKTADDMRAFFGWYSSVLSLLPDHADQHTEAMNQVVEAVGETCEKLVQQQLYHSWWALGETIESRLEPQLGELRAICERLATSWSDASGSAGDR
ncbi:MAG: hypothetical protein KDD44_07565 [Bdellovibrionales bacterium]|nr:hypothetical protein [Bdellovibrionales bacterium]